MASWELFLRSKMEWVQALLVDVHFYTTDNGQPNLYKVLADHDKYGGMSFGYTLATPDGKRIVGRIKMPM